MLARGVERRSRRGRRRGPLVHRHRLAGVRLRRQPDRQRGAVAAGQPRLRLRGAARAGGLEARALRGRPRRRRAARLHGLDSVAAANSKAYGGGMYAAPDAELDDGMLDVVVCEHTSRRRLLRRICRRSSRAPTSSSPRSTSSAPGRCGSRADRPFTVYADGDPIGDLPVTLRASPAPCASWCPGMTARLQARRGARGRRALAPRRPRRDEPARQGAHAPGAARDRRASPARLRARQRRRSRPPTARRRRRRWSPRSSSAAARASSTTARARTWPAASPPRCWTRHAGGVSPATSGCSRSTSSGWTASSESSAAGAAAGQPVPRPARPLRRAGDDRRPLGRGGRRGAGAHDARRSTPTTRWSPTSAAIAPGRRRTSASRTTRWRCRGCSTRPTPSTAGAAARRTATTPSSWATSAATTATPAARRGPAPQVAAAGVVLDGVRGRALHAAHAGDGERSRRAPPARPLQRLQRAGRGGAGAGAGRVAGRRRRRARGGLRPPSGAPRPCAWAAATCRSCWSRTRPGANEVLRTLALEHGRARPPRGAQRPHRRRARRVLGLGRRLRGARRPRAARDLQRHARGRDGAAAEVRGRARRAHRRSSRSSSAGWTRALGAGDGRALRAAHLHGDARAARRCSWRAARPESSFA